jgi:hypothetical protein
VSASVTSAVGAVRTADAGGPLVEGPPAGRSGWRAAALAHPVLTVLVVAALARTTCAVVLQVGFGGTVFADDTTYLLMATQRAAGATAGWDDYTRTLYETTKTFTGPLSLLFWLFGPSALLGQLLAGAFGTAAAALTARCALEVVPRGWALAAGLVVALMPSQVLFSSTVLKDAAVWAVLAGLAVCAAVLGRSTGPRLVAALLVAAALLVLLLHLRVHTLVAASWALGIAACFGVPAWRWRRAAAVLVLVVAVPWSGALGPAGLGLVLDAQGTLEARRLANAAGAATAVVPTTPATPTPTPAPGSTAAPAPAVDPADGGGATSLRYLPRGLSVILLEPFPWSTEGNRRVQLALLENLLWWPLLGLALVGLLRGRDRLRVLAFPALAGSAIALMYGLTEGNFGTAFRHRGEIVWAVVLLAAVGAWQLQQRRQSRRAER